MISTGGAIGSLNCSWVTPVSEAEIRIYGTEGEAIIDYQEPGGLRYRLTGEAAWTAMLPLGSHDLTSGGYWSNVQGSATS